MKDSFFVAVALVALFLVGFSDRGAINVPASVNVDASVNTVPVAFSSGAGSLVKQGLNGNFYAHISIQNDTKSPISFMTLPEVSSAPAASVTGQRLFVVSSGAHSFDNISIFNNLYIQSEDNPIAQGNIWINVW